MPANNPIVGGRHVSSYSSGAGSVEPAAEAPAPIGSSMGKGYNIPVVTIVAFALVLLLLFRAWGFAALASARVTVG